MVRNPMPVNNLQREAYMRPAAKITCPPARRRASRRGAAGRQVVRRMR